MYIFKPYRWITALTIAAILCLQFAGNTHAAEYGNAPHHHDGEICIIGTVSSDIVAIATPCTEVLEPAQYTFTTQYVPANLKRPISPFSSRAPPPRGPPL